MVNTRLMGRAVSREGWGSTDPAGEHERTTNSLSAAAQKRMPPYLFAGAPARGTAG
jgi:hypothetical protein